MHGLPGPWVLKYVPSDFLGLTISDAWTSWASLECVAKIRVVFQVECCFTGPFSVRSFNGSLPALVAQLDRASDYGSEGWGFESLRARKVYQVRGQANNLSGVRYRIYSRWKGLLGGRREWQRLCFWRCWVLWIWNKLERKRTCCLHSSNP